LIFHSVKLQGLTISRWIPRPRTDGEPSLSEFLDSQAPTMSTASVSVGRAVYGKAAYNALKPGEFPRADSLLTSSARRKAVFAHLWCPPRRNWKAVTRSSPNVVVWRRCHP
jgi:hypothetical protein